MKCSRRKALIDELSHDWDKLNLAARILIIIGAVVYCASLFVAFYKVDVSNTIFNSIEVVFRSTLASIFGFILSSNIKNDAKNNKALSRNDCEVDIDYYNLREGNSVQILIAFCICITCTIAILAIYVFNLVQDIAAISQLRDLMCTSIGFLLGESKIKK